MKDKRAGSSHTIVTLGVNASYLLYESNANKYDEVKSVPSNTLCTQQGVGCRDSRI